MSARPSHKAARLAVVISHPIQYYSPWFRHLADLDRLELKVFYLWDYGVKATKDEKFGGEAFKWDIPLLDGYTHEFIENTSPDPGTHHFGGLKNPALLLRLTDWAPDAVLLFGYKFDSFQKIIHSRQFRTTPLIFRGDSHVLYPERGPKAWLKRRLLKSNYKRFSRFLTVGAANEGYFASCGVPAEKMIRAPHCVDNERFRSAQPEAEKAAAAWRDELGIPQDAFVFLFAGKFEDKKRPLDLLAAFQNLPAGSAYLLFVGGGDHEDELREKAGKNVIFAPFQNQTEMPRTYATGDILVLPSFGRGETWGLAVNEAMNLARPAIVSSHVGCGPDLVETGRTGWIFRAGDVQDLTEALEGAVQNPERTALMGQSAQKLVAEYNYDRAAKAVLQAVEAINAEHD